MTLKDSFGKFQRQLLRHGLPHRPAHQLASVQVQHQHHVQPALHYWVAAATIAALLCASTAHAAETIANFDTVGTAYTLGTCVNTPGPGPVIVTDPDSSGFLRLADAMVPSHGTISFDQSNPGLFPEVVVTFRMRITPQSGRADGMGVALLNTAIHGVSGGVCPSNFPWAAEQPNFPGALGIGFDIYPNADLGDLNNNHLGIHFNGTRLYQIDAAPIDLASGEWLTVTVHVRAGEAASYVTVIIVPADGVPVASKTYGPFAIPGLAPYESRLWFGARSGGESALHDIDDVSVAYNATPVFSAPLLGSATGVSINSITCENVSTGQAVTFTENSLPWNCVEHGLDGRPGDIVRQLITGTWNGEASNPDTDPGGSPKPAPALGVQPGNDAWSSATLIAATPYVANQSIASATAEPGEPMWCGGFEKGSVWFRYKTPTFGLLPDLLIDAIGSDFQPIVTVFRDPFAGPSSVDSLSFVTCGILQNIGTSALHVAVSPATNYYIQVRPWGALNTFATGKLHLSVSSQQCALSLVSDPPNGGVTTGAGQVSCWSTRNISAAPKHGFTFLDWTENGALVSTETQLTVTVGFDRTLVAHFQPVDSPPQPPQPPQMPPPMPGVPLATAPQFRQLDLRWPPVTGADRIEIALDYDKRMITTVAGTATSASFSNLSANGEFYNSDGTYRAFLRACNSAGCSGWTADGVGMNPPPTPNVDATSPAPGQVVLRWPSVPGADRIEVVMVGTNLVLKTLPGSDTSLTISVPDPGISNLFTVTACNAAGCSDRTQFGKTANGQ